MKKLFVILLSMIIVASASAQHRYVTTRHYSPPVRSRVIVSYGSYPAYYYSPGYYDYGFYRPYSYRPSRLALEIDDIQSDYKDRIWSVRHDDRLSKRQRKMKIHQLKSDRDQAIRDAERNYYRSY